MKSFAEVVLFGPTNAKSELYNSLRQNHQFDNAKMEVINSDKMTDHQQHEFVRDYFKKYDIKSL